MTFTITLAEARTWLTGKDLAEFKWSVDDFIKHGKEAAIDPALIKQLENASAKFHVSKLEALKAQTQMTLEKLYGQTGETAAALMKQTYLDGFYHTEFMLQQGFGVGWDMSALNEAQIESILSKPWTIDKETFSDRLWKQKQGLVNEVHTQLSQNMILGKAPDDAIKAIANKFNSSRYNAGRIVMTESAYFGNLAQRNAFGDLGVEEYEVVVTLDEKTCEVCSPYDGKHFPMSQWEAGITAPIFHPFCRCCTAPYFEDLDGERFARDDDGTAYYVPSDMTYPDWKKTFIDGGSKDGLKAIPNGDGVVSWVRESLTKAAESAIMKAADFVNKQEAITFFTNDLGVAFKDSRKYPINEELSIDIANSVNSFKNEFPVFSQDTNMQIPIIEIRPASKMTGKNGTFEYYASGKPVALALNGANFTGDYGDIAMRVAEDSASNWTFPNAKPVKTFMHEWGHAIDNALSHLERKAGILSKSVIGEAIDEFKAANPTLTVTSYLDMTNYISRYGVYSEAEAFAETFAEAFTSDSPREFATIFRKILTKRIKGVT